MRIVDLSNLQQFAAVQLLSDPGHIAGPIRIPNCIRVVFNWTLPGTKTAHNVLYGRTAGTPAPTVAMAQAIFSAMSSGAAWTTLAGNLAGSVTFASVTVQSVHDIQLEILSSTGTAVPGAGAGAAVPNEVALAVTFKSAKLGPANRGRIFIPGWVTTNVQTTNLALAGAVTALDTWAKTITSVFGGQGMTHVIGQPARAAYVSDRTGRSFPARAAGSVDVTQIVVRNAAYDSQRRRGLK